MKDEPNDAHASRLGPTRAEVLEHLQRLTAPAPWDAIAEAVGIHQNTARFHHATPASQLHLGLMRGILGSDQPWEVVSVEPWAGPTTCRVTLLQQPQNACLGNKELTDA